MRHTEKPRFIKSPVPPAEEAWDQRIDDEIEVGRIVHKYGKKAFGPISEQFQGLKDDSDQLKTRMLLRRHRLY